MGFPNTTFRTELPPVVRKELDQSNADTAGYLSAEHDEEGRHTHLTAKSLKVKGPVTITGGPLTINGAPVTPGGGTAVAPHHATHEPGGSDPLVGAAWLAQANTFTGWAQFLTADNASLILKSLLAPADGRVIQILDTTAGELLIRGLSDDLQSVRPAMLLTVVGDVTVQRDLRAGRNLSVTGDAYANMVIATSHIYSNGGSAIIAGNIYERGRNAVAMGEWQDVPFSAANFTASGGAAWTVAAGNVALNRYALIGKTLIWALYLTGGSISGATPAELYIRVPGGFTVKPYVAGATAQLMDPGAHNGTVYANANTTVVTVQQNPYAFFAINSGMVVMFTISLEIL